MGYHLAGFDVVGVDHNPQPHYPFEFIRADVLMLEPTFVAAFDAIHASPPCQRYSQAAKLHANSTTHPDLVEPTRAMLDASGLPYVIENVVGAPLETGIVLCGTMFGLPLIKHRCFEGNFPLFTLLPPCNHTNVYDPWHGAGRSAEKFRAAQETPWIPSSGGASRKRGETGDLSNAIPPAYTRFIGGELLRLLATRKEAA